MMTFNCCMWTLMRWIKTDERKNICKWDLTLSKKSSKSWVDIKCCSLKLAFYHFCIIETIMIRQILLTEVFWSEVSIQLKYSCSIALNLKKFVSYYLYILFLSFTLRLFFLFKIFPILIMLIVIYFIFSNCCSSWNSNLLNYP